MTRYIDADALIPMIKYATTDSEIGVFPIKIGFDAIAEVIYHAPTVDAEPVRHGMWIVTNEGMVKCSECKRKFILLKENYCPNCGARMDKDDEVD